MGVKSSIYFVFLDGVGLGADDPHVNPLADLRLPAFEFLAGGHRWLRGWPQRKEPDHCVTSLDATLGLAGLPQSGTGQATLFTGVNCAALVGRHFGPYPHSATWPVLATENLFTKVQALGLPFEEPAAFLNAYPDRFFSYTAQTGRWTVTTRCCREANLRIRTHDDLVAGYALPADLTGTGWPQHSTSFQTISEAAAGQRLVHVGKQHALTLFEYFQTDKAGHSQSAEKADTVLRGLDRFLAAILDTMEPLHDLLIITSDHGNLEDLSSKSHTRNLVPLVAYGKGANIFYETTDLTNVTPAVLQLLASNMNSCG